MNASHARLVLALSACLLASCHRSDDTAAAAQAPKPDAAGFTVVEWALPTTDGAAQPDLVVAPNGSLLLSWVRPMGDRHAFQYAAYLGDDNWESAPKTIAVGRALAANWANTPHILMTDDGALWAQWLQAHPGGSEHAADVVLTQSRDGGMHWMAPVTVNDDGSASEHGFVSLWPSAQDAVGIAWLDGRKAAAAGVEHMHADSTHGDSTHTDTTHAAHHAAGAAMTLRATNFDATMARSGEVEIDPMTCDCCSTDAAVTTQGALLVYRDRDAGEIRDIVAVRHTAQGWSKPQPVHADQWKMPACPLNGPAVDARGNEVVVAWYSAPNDQPVLQLARSHDGGAHFDAPVEIDRGEAVAGRVDVALDGDAAWLLWLREDGKGQSLQIARQARTDAKPQRSMVASLQGRGRATGYPQLAVREGIAHVVWTDIVGGVTRLRGARVKAAPAATASR
jgi:hypothetical protein